MQDLLAGLLFGHFIGDYLLQNKWMALNKGRNDRIGYSACALHCLIYTASIFILLRHLPAWFYAFVFASHFVLDKWSLGQKWLDLIGGRNFMKSWANKEDQYRDIHIAFDCIVYTVVDNGLHLLLMWLVANWALGG